MTDCLKASFMKSLYRRFHISLLLAFLATFSQASHADETCQKPPLKEDFLQKVGCLYQGYASLENFNQTGSEVAFVDSKGKIVKPFKQFDKFNSQGNGLYSFQDPKTKLYGFLDYKGDVLVTPQFYLVYSPTESGIIHVRNNDGKEGIVINNDPRSIKFLYDFASPLEKLPIVFVQNGGKYGMIDKYGKTLLPIVYDDIKASQEGMRTLQKNGKWGFVDDNFKLVIPFEYEEWGFFKDGLAIIKKNGKYGVIDKQNNTVIPFKYEYISEFENGFTWANLGDKYGIIDKTGKPSFAFQPQKIQTATHGFYIIGNEGKQGLIDQHGNFILEQKYQAVNVVEGNVVSFQQHGKWGLADTKGNILYPAKAKNPIIFMFSDPAEIEVNGKTHYINRQGKIVK